MTTQTVVLNNGRLITCFVVAQKSFRYDAMSIQITKVLDLEGAIYKSKSAEVPYRFVYEEIVRNDVVIYARFMGRDNISRNYPWAKEIL